MIHLFPKRIRVHGATRRAVDALAVAVVFSTGCATAINGRTQRVAVVSDPPGAQVFIADEPVGVTPASVELDRRDGDVALRFEKDCYRETVLSVPRRTSKRVLVNLLAAGVYINDYGLGSALGAMAFWGVLGGLLDRREGGAFTFPDLVRADLERLPDTAKSEESGGGPGIDDGCVPGTSAGTGDHGIMPTER